MWVFHPKCPELTCNWLTQLSSSARLLLTADGIVEDLGSSPCLEVNSFYNPFVNCSSWLASTCCTSSHDIADWKGLIGKRKTSRLRKGFFCFRSDSYWSTIHFIHEDLLVVEIVVFQSLETGCLLTSITSASTILSSPLLSALSSCHHGHSSLFRNATSYLSKLYKLCSIMKTPDKSRMV